MPGLGGPYETKANILAFLQKIKSDLTLADISDVMYNSSTEQINNRTDTYWKIYSGSLYINGEGIGHIYSPVVPIATLTGLSIISSDLTEETLDVSGSDREVAFDIETGLIERISQFDLQVEKGIEYGESGSVFPIGIDNIKITGTFGRDALLHDSLNILKFLQTLIVARMMGFMYPTDFNAVDIAEEKIGEYSYKIGDMQYSNNDKNQKRTLEGYIEYLFSILPQDDKNLVLGS